MESHTLCVLSGFSCLPTTYEFHGIPHFLCWYRKDTVVCLLFNINYFSLLPVLGLLACPLLPGEIKRCQCASLEGTGWTDGSLFPKLSSSLLVCGFVFFFLFVCLIFKWGHFIENVRVFHLVLWLVESQNQIRTFHLRNTFFQNFKYISQKKNNNPENVTSSFY